MDMSWDACEICDLSKTGFDLRLTNIAPSLAALSSELQFEAIDLIGAIFEEVSETLMFSVPDIVWQDSRRSRHFVATFEGAVGLVEITDIQFTNHPVRAGRGKFLDRRNGATASFKFSRRSDRNSKPSGRATPVWPHWEYLLHAVAFNDLARSWMQGTDKGYGSSNAWTIVDGYNRLCALERFLTLRAARRPRSMMHAPRALIASFGRFGQRDRSMVVGNVVRTDIIARVMVETRIVARFDGCSGTPPTGGERGHKWWLGLIGVCQADRTCTTRETLRRHVASAHSSSTELTMFEANGDANIQAARFMPISYVVDQDDDGCEQYGLPDLTVASTVKNDNALPPIWQRRRGAGQDVGGMDYLVGYRVLEIVTPQPDERRTRPTWLLPSGEIDSSSTVAETLRPMPVAIDATATQSLTLVMV